MKSMDVLPTNFPGVGSVMIGRGGSWWGGWVFTTNSTSGLPLIQYDSHATNTIC